jgi:small subunit ribosomal protein S2
VLFVGTKKQAREVIEEEAKRANCPFVTYRWLGGMLTNHTTIRRSLKTLETFDQMSIDGTYEKLTKKEQLSINKLRTKLERTLGGVKDMRKLPGAVFVIDTKREAIAVAEARKLGILVFAIVDTNVDPDKIDYKIPANDDAFKSIWLILRTIADAILEGKAKSKDYTEVLTEDKRPRDTKGRSRRPRKRRQRNDAPPVSESKVNQVASADMKNDTAGNKPTAPVTDVDIGNIAKSNAKKDASAGNIASPSKNVDDSAGNISSDDDKQTKAKGNKKESTE